MPRSRRPIRLRFRRGSITGDGQRMPRDEPWRDRWRRLIDEARDTRRLPPRQYDVALALLGKLRPNGRLDPSYDELARAAKCSVATACVAVAGLHELQLIVPQRRRVILPDGSSRQRSNAYALTMPTGGALPAAKAATVAPATAVETTAPPEPLPDSSFLPCLRVSGTSLGEAAPLGPIGSGAGLAEVAAAMADRLARRWEGRRTAGNRPGAG